ncbi:uncharacterized protein CC84DRAFT_1187660 [Paraphaeosphaeria sporulosa]|uniref:Uncharacterized protein n=1 Tax=Paraphaeosphaeria sporulosa TaxID=1460663 RepID=A0A177CCZ7_9PLEO|nr:uncharacterized protein CC84DRAFT_1187660 [Paraphaeosphaeria sporulosa]OAG04648.1 hypothetical protein CC84DRAFT_1187660 [Paraphaeosphaeria sporulosa]
MTNSELEEDQGRYDEEEEEEEEEEYEPSYSVKELAEIVLDFYKFLATLHYDRSDLHIPPPEGWPLECLPKNVIRKKSSRTIELMRHLPYFKEAKKSTHLHYKCKLYDYTDAEQHDGIRLIPCPGRETEEAESVPEREEHIDQSEVLAQELEWGTDLDWQFVRQVYREFGWPDAFRREEAVRVIEDFMALKSNERGEWEEAFN